MRFADPVNRIRGALSPSDPHATDGGAALCQHVPHFDCGCPGTLVLHEVEEVADVPGHGRMLVTELRWESWFQHGAACRNGGPSR